MMSIELETWLACGKLSLSVSEAVLEHSSELAAELGVKALRPQHPLFAQASNTRLNKSVCLNLLF